MVMPLADLGTITDYFNSYDGRSIGPRKLDTLLLLAAGMEYLHEEHVAHLDLKAANVLMHKGQIKIIDFGFSMLAGHEAVGGPPLRIMIPAKFNEALHLSRDKLG
ncbi:hypothetical protein HDV00_003428 [Rhizophlyctis rosea]|nr:hypothetical protein HDV00_003428 [Rhizophlyctis rosea]